MKEVESLEMSQGGAESVEFSERRERVIERGKAAEVVEGAERHRHGWLGRHFCRLNFRKLGWFGIVVFVLHILFHVAEVLLLPAVLVWLGMG